MPWMFKELPQKEGFEIVSFSSEILCKLYKEFQMRTFLLSSVCIKIYIIFRKNVAELFMSSLYRLISLLFSHTGMSTGCSIRKYYDGAETDHFWLHLSKAKMCLKSCRIFQYSIIWNNPYVTPCNREPGVDHFFRLQVSLF